MMQASFDKFRGHTFVVQPVPYVSISTRWMIQILPGHAQLSMTVRYTHFATKTFRGTVSPFEVLERRQEHTIRRGLE